MRVVAIVGGIGSGKTTLAFHLALEELLQNAVKRKLIAVVPTASYSAVSL